MSLPETEKTSIEAIVRRSGEGALRERGGQYQSIFEATSDGLIINDLETGIIVEANPAACRMHGYQYDDLVGRHPREIIHPDDHHLFDEFVRTVRAGGEFRGRSRD